MKFAILAAGFYISAAILYSANRELGGLCCIAGGVFMTIAVARKD